jgi:hypothetical protein
LSPRCFERFRASIQATQEKDYRVVSMGEAKSAKGYREDSKPDLAYTSPHWFDRIFNPAGLPKLTDEKEHGSPR